MGMERSIDSSENSIKGTEKNQIIQKRGGLNFNQAREVSKSIEIFTTDKELKSENDQINAINKFIEIVNIGQKSGLLELNEAKTVSNIIDLFSPDNECEFSDEDLMLEI